MDNIWIGLEERDERGPKGRILLCKLERKCGEDELEITAILKTSRAEEGCSQTAICEHPFCNGLRDRGFPCPRKSIKPEDRRLVEIFGPPLDFIQHTLPGSLEAATPVPMPIFGPLRTTAAVQHKQFGC